MTRKAFLIASPQERTSEDYLPGVIPDIEDMREYLMSLKGGGWYEWEIEVLTNPSRYEILDKISGYYDFVIVQYSGHGFEYTDKGVQLCLSDKESIGLWEIHRNIDAPRRFYFVDCCRGIEDGSLHKSFEAFSALNESINQRRKCIRKKYENILNSCEEGCSVIFSCSKNESAGEDEDGLGGQFTLSFLRTAQTANPTTNEYCSIKDIFLGAVGRMNNDYPLSSQNPVILPERRLRYFPFVVNTDICL